MAKAPTSYIQTTGTARTRTADSLSFPFAVRPQAMTFYVRLVDLEAVPAAVSRYFLILGGGTGVSYVAFYVTSGGASYTMAVFNATSSVTATVTRSVAVGQSVELVGTLTAAGVAQMATSVAGGSIVTGTASSGLALPPAWGSATLKLTDTNQAVIAVRDVLGVRGVHSLATMRNRIGLTP